MEFGTLSLLKPLVAVGALAIGGMGAYNLATTGCPLGTCDAPQGAATAAATTPEPLSCCADEQAAQTALVADATDQDCDMGCSGDSVGMVAGYASTNAPAMGTCDMSDEACEAMRAACEASGECPESMMAACKASGMDCSAHGELVAETDKSECTGKTECQQTADQVAQTEAEGDTEASDG